MTDCDIVKKIIDDELKTSESVSKYYVLEQIKNRISPTRLFNKTLTYSQDRADAATDDGIENINRGAKKVFRDCMRSLKRHFSMKDEVITRNNSFSNSIIEFNGERKTVADWSKDVGVDSQALKFRLNSGWSIEKALTTPAMKRNQSKRKSKLMQILYDTIPDEGADRESLITEFGKNISDEYAIEISQMRDETARKRGKGCPTARDRDSAITRGKRHIFTQKLFYLRRDGRIVENNKFIQKSNKAGF